MQYNKENQNHFDITNYLTPKCFSSTRSISLHEDRNSTQSSKISTSSSVQQLERQLKQQWQELAKDWQRNKRDVKVYQLAEIGIPFSARKQIWPLIVGNRHQITKDLFNILQIKTKTVKVDPKDNLGRLSTINHIKQDLGRTFAILSTDTQYFKGLQSMFHPGGPLSENLLQILEAFCFYRPDIGYVQGMTYIASILLTYFDDYQTFVIFTSLITHPQLIQIYLLDDNTINNIIFVQFNKLIKLNIPHVYKLFKLYNITCSNYLLDWILTLYAKPLNPDIVGRIWDRMLVNGTHILWKCGIAILKILAPKFTNEGNVLLHLKNPDIKENQLFQEMKNVNYPFEISEILSNLEI